MIIFGGWLVAITIRQLCQYFAKSIGYKVSERIGIDATLHSFHHVSQLDMAWHEHENSGNKIKRIQNASDGLNQILRIWFNSLIEILINLVGIGLIIGSFGWGILGVLFLFLVSYFFLARAMTRRAGQASIKVNQQEEQVSGLLYELMNNIRTVKVMGMAKSLSEDLTEKTQELFSRLGTRIFWYQSRNSFLSFWGITFRIGMLIFIAWGIVQGWYELGFLVLFNSYFNDLWISTEELADASLEFTTSKLSIARMQKILDEPINIDNNRGKVAFSPTWKQISMHNVSFAYGDNEVLQDISFEIKRGEKIGIIGLSGAGKSTLFKLLLKEREEFAGDILFDSVSIKKIRRDDYFKYVSVVLQDTEVFNLSLRDNIVITNAKQRTNQRLLKQALETAHIKEFVHKLPEGIDTLIGEKGVKLSGGERQRLGIARAIFKQPQILLLDEATSHLDLESEEKIRDSLHKFFENVTAIVIAHRLSTIKEMDKILVIENGRVVEAGSFEELQALGGRFKELWGKQKL